jgi:hypothetical protein
VGRNDGGVAKTPLHAFRIPDDIYYPAMEKAKAEGVNLSDIVRDALIEYVEGDESEGSR